MPSHQDLVEKASRNAKSLTDQEIESKRIFFYF
jgi:hypothetical protein